MSRSLANHSPEGSGATFILYDDSCGPCTRFVHVVKLLDVKNCLTPVSLFDPGARELVGEELSESQIDRSFHLFFAEHPIGTRVFSQGRALLQLLRFFPITCMVADFLSKSQFITNFSNWFYLQVSRIRAVGCELDKGQVKASRWRAIHRETETTLRTPRKVSFSELSQT
jgi:hypothetical protein